MPTDASAAPSIPTDPSINPAIGVNVTPRIEVGDVIQQGAATRLVMDREFISTYKQDAQWSPTLDVKNVRHVKLTNTTAQNLNGMANGALGQVVHVLGDGKTTAVYNAAVVNPSAPLITSTGASKLLKTGLVYRFIFYPGATPSTQGTWREDAGDAGGGASETGVAAVYGTAGQIVVSPNVGAVTVSLPATITPSLTFSGTITVGPGPLVVGTDPGGTDLVRVGGNISIQGGAALSAVTGQLNVNANAAGGQINFNVQAGARARVTAADFSPQSAGGLTLGTAALPWGPAYLKKDASNVFIYQGGGSLLWQDTWTRINDGDASIHTVLSLSGTSGNYYDAVNHYWRGTGGVGAYATMTNAAFYPSTITANLTLGLGSNPWGRAFHTNLSTAFANSGFGVLALRTDESVDHLYFETTVVGHANWVIGTGTGRGGNEIGFYDRTNSSLRLAIKSGSFVEVVNGGLQVTAGNIGVGGAPLTDRQIFITGSTFGAQASVYGLVASPVSPSTATSGVSAGYFTANTSAAVYTTTAMYGVFIDTGGKGAGSTITTQYGLYVNNQSLGAANFSIYTNLGPVSIGDATTIRSGGLQVTAGNVGIGGAPVNYVGVYLRPTNTLSASSAYDFYGGATFDSTVTGSGIVFGGQVITTAAAYTMAAAEGLHIYDASLGAGSAITTQYGIRIDALTKGTNNFAIYTNTGAVRFGDDVTVLTLGVFDSSGTRFDGSTPVGPQAYDVLSWQPTRAKWEPRFLQLQVSAGVLKAAANGDGTFSVFAFDGRALSGTSVAGPTPTVTPVYGGFIVNVGSTLPANFAWDIEWTNSANGNTGGPVRITSQQMVFQFFSNNSSIPFGTTATTFQFKVSQTGGTAAVYGTPSTAVAASTVTEVNAFGLIVASQISCVNLAAISADLGVIAAGVLQDSITGSTKGIFIKSTAFEQAVPSTWTTGIFFSGANPVPGTVTGPYIDFTATGTNFWLKGPSGNFTVDASGNVVVNGVLKIQLNTSSTYARVTGSVLTIVNQSVTGNNNVNVVVGSVSIGANAFASGQGLRFTILGRFNSSSLAGTPNVQIRLRYGGADLLAFIQIFGTSAGVDAPFLLHGIVAYGGGATTIGSVYVAGPLSSGAAATFTMLRLSSGITLSNAGTLDISVIQIVSGTTTTFIDEAVVEYVAP